MPATDFMHVSIQQYDPQVSTMRKPERTYHALDQCPEYMNLFLQRDIISTAGAAQQSV